MLIEAVLVSGDIKAYYHCVLLGTLTFDEHLLWWCSSVFNLEGLILQWALGFVIEVELFATLRHFPTFLQFRPCSSSFFPTYEVHKLELLDQPSNNREHFWRWVRSISFTNFSLCSGIVDEVGLILQWVLGFVKEVELFATSRHFPTLLQFRPRSEFFGPIYEVHKLELLGRPTKL